MRPLTQLCTFTVGDPQVFTGGETWSDFTPLVGDFNGDGKADLAFTTVGVVPGLPAIVYVALSAAGGVVSLSARHDLGSLSGGYAVYKAFAGDFNGDGKTDLVFNSTCQKVSYVDSTCTGGVANLIYTALSNGFGGFNMSGVQNYGSGWSDYSAYYDVVGDVNGDGRSDLVWFSFEQAAGNTTNNLVVAGIANADGTFQLGSAQNFGSVWTGDLTLADINHDGKADLLWNNTPLYPDEQDVDTYAAATSNGNGTFNNLGPGAVHTGPGDFQTPEANALTRLPTGLTVVSTYQDSISDALVMVSSGPLGGTLYLPLVRR